MALNTNSEKRKYEKQFSPLENWMFYKANGTRRAAYSKKIFKTEKSAKEQWGFDNTNPMNKGRLFKKHWGFRAWGRVSKK